MREEAIEAMARGLRQTPQGPDYQWSPSRDDARIALDALLVFLTEHADEWMVAARNRPPFPTEVPNMTGLRRALAVLSADREDAE